MRGKSIVEALLAFMLFYLFIWIVLTEFAELERNVLGWSYSAGFLMILIPVFILLLTKKEFRILRAHAQGVEIQP